MISSMGYWGIGIAMAIESCNILLPSEIILPYGGYLVYKGTLTYFGASLAGAIGGTVGSLISYYIGLVGGRPFLDKYGSYIGLPSRRLLKAERWMFRNGELTIFVTRLLPGIRTFISFPAGAAKMNVVHFTIYTFLGSLIWSLLLTKIGVILGENWDTLQPWFQKFDLIVILALLLFILYVQFKRRKKTS